MTWWLWLLIVVIVAAIAIALLTTVVLKRRRERTARLRGRFGPEYERAVRVAGGRRSGEDELEERLTRHGKLQLTTFDAASGPGYEAEWSEIATQFERAELPALARAEALVTTLLAERGYPMESFDQRAADLSVDYPEEVGHYRRAHDTYRGADEGKGTREDFYEALQHYRAFLDALCGTGSSGEREFSAEPPQRPPRPLEQPAQAFGESE